MNQLNSTPKPELNVEDAALTLAVRAIDRARRYNRPMKAADIEAQQNDILAFIQQVSDQRVQRFVDALYRKSYLGRTGAYPHDDSTYVIGDDIDQTLSDYLSHKEA